MTSTPIRPHYFGRAALAVSLSVTLLGLAGCGALSAQNPSSALKPVNAVEIAPDARVMLKGADVVAYFSDGRYEQGLPQFKSTYEEVTFHFATAARKAQFDQSPAAFLPQFGGYCANGLVYGIPWGGDANTWKMIDGKLYIFGGQAAKTRSSLMRLAMWPCPKSTGQKRSKGATASCSAPNAWCFGCHITKVVPSWPRRWPRPKPNSPERLAPPC